MNIKKSIFILLFYPFGHYSFCQSITWNTSDLLIVEYRSKTENLYDIFALKDDSIFAYTLGEVKIRINDSAVIKNVYDSSFYYMKIKNSKVRLEQNELMKIGSKYFLIYQSSKSNLKPKGAENTILVELYRNNKYWSTIYLGRKKVYKNRVFDFSTFSTY